MKNFLFVSLVLFLGFVSCEDFLEKDLSGQTVLLNAPQNGDSLLINTVNFWWDIVDGATGYQLRIATPNFVGPTQLIIDTITEGNTFDFALLPGIYEWQIRAVNSSSGTPFVTRAIYIVENDDLSIETLNLNTPLNNAYVNDLVVNFSWNELIKAESYLFNLNYENGNTVFTNNSTPDLNIDRSLPEEGAFEWFVQGINASSSTPESDRRTIIADLTPPAASLLLLPSNGSSQDTTFVNFTWNSDVSLAPIVDTFKLYSDFLITEIQSITITNEELSVNLPSSGTFYWRVRSGDEAGNSGVFSETRSIIIN